MPTALCTPATASATIAPGLPAPSALPAPAADPATRRRAARPAREPLEQRLPRMARAFATLFLEVEAGLRPRKQLRNLMCPVLYARLEEAWIRDDGEPPARLLNVLAGWDVPGCYDVVCTVSRGGRITALAFRLRRGVDGWKVDDLARPEDGPLPDPAYPVPTNEPDIFELVGA